MKGFVDNYRNASGESNSTCVRRCTILHLLNKSKKQQCIDACPDDANATVEDNTYDEDSTTNSNTDSTSTTTNDNSSSSSTSTPDDSTNTVTTSYTPPIDSTVQNFINFLKSTSNTEFQTIYTFFGTINDQVKKGYTTSQIVSNFGGNTSNPSDVSYIGNLITMYKNPQVLQTVLDEAGKRNIISSLQTQNLSDLLDNYKKIISPSSASSFTIGMPWKIVGAIVLLSGISFGLYKIFHKKATA